MRFIVLFFIGLQISLAQVSKTTNYTLGSLSNVVTVSHIYTPNHSKYLVSLQDMPTGAISVGIGVTKLNACDEVEWSNIYVKHAHPYYRADIISETGTDNVYILGTYSVNSNRHLSVIKLDPSGNIIFSKYYDFGNDLLSTFYTTYSTQSGGLVISAKYAPVGGGSSNTSMITLDANGDLLNASKHYDTYSGVSTAQISDDVYIHRSSSHIYQVRTNGQVDWAKKYGTAFQYSNFFNMVNQPDGYVMVVSRSSDHFLAKVNPNGELLWVTDIKTLGSIPPLITGNSNNEILLCSYIDYNGENVPLIITYDSEGNNLKEEIITDINTKVYNYPSISKTPTGNLNLFYPGAGTGTATYIQNIESSLCKETISIPEVENLLDVSYTNTPVHSSSLTLTALHDIDMTVWDLYVEDSVRCEPVLIVDSVYSSALIDCNTGFVYSGDPDYNYYWPHDGSSDAEKTLDSVGVYVVEIENCFSKTRKFITVTSVCGCKLNVPNAFTPNGDQTNDVFQIYDNCGIKSFEIHIYDRWGKRLFHSKDIQESWDGTYNGKPVKSDVYFYQIQYTPLSIDAIIPTETLEGIITVIY